MSGWALVCDAGGTSVRFGLARKTPDGIALRSARKYSEETNALGEVVTPRFAGFSDALAHWIDDFGEDVRGMTALFALAGAVESDGTIDMTNRKGWPVINPRALEAQFGLASVTLVNDFAAMARCVPEIPAADFVEVLPGTPRAGAPIIVTGPGTGFGVASLLDVRIGGTQRWVPLTGQGGHAAYAAHTVREAKLSERLSNGRDYVSTEMVVSGKWLQPVFDELSDLHGRPRAKLEPQVISERAMAGDPVAQETCLLRARGIMGAAGDLVLINGGQGGVVLTGTVAERMVPWLRHPEAVARFRQRGSETPFMADVPVRVLTHSEGPLIGAAALLFDQLG